ncbi:MAG TPA: ABC transporter permease [Casimicrobiaceae bacterium]|nr:ABC transporter permease [Casimicrobiaceae bacterium]
MKASTHLYWSLRRELWENRSIWIAPAVIAAVILAAFVIKADLWSANLRTLDALEPVKQLMAIAMPYGIGASAVLLCGWLVAAFYSLDAMSAERRDRSILFWKSMPVSDTTTVIAKVVTASIVVPLVALAVALLMQAAMLIASTAILAAQGIDPSIPWTRLPWIEMTVAMFYGMAAHALWFAPIVAYLLLMSTLTHSVPPLWAVLPIVAAGTIEVLAFGTRHVAALVQYRLVGGMQAFKPAAMDSVARFEYFEPIRFLSTPGLWSGLAFAAVCIAAAIRLRRYRDPL